MGVSIIPGETILILFGAGKLPKVAGDIAKGIKSFKQGMKDDPQDNEKITDKTCAILCESILGESGIKVIPNHCLQGLRKLCDEKKLSMDQYLSTKHLRVAPMDAPISPIDRALSQLNLERNISVRIDLITMSPYILKNSDLVLTLPSKTAKRLARNYNFFIAELPVELETRQTKIIWHKELTNHPAFDWMKERLSI